MSIANSGSVGRGKPFATEKSQPTVDKPLVVVPRIVPASILARQQASPVKRVESATR